MAEMTPSEAVGAQIRAMREALGWKQTPLAEKLGPGWSQPRLSMIESGKQSTLVDDVFEIAAALGIDVDAVMKGAQERLKQAISEQKQQED